MQLPSARTLLSLSSGNTRDEEEDRASNPSSQQMNANGGGDPFTAANINVYQYNEQQSRKYPPPQCAATLPAHPESSDPLFWAYHQIPPASTSGVRPHQTSAHILSNIEPLRHSGGPYPIPLRAVHDDYRSHAYDPYRQHDWRVSPSIRYPGTSPTSSRMPSFHYSSANEQPPRVQAHLLPVSSSYSLQTAVHHSSTMPSSTISREGSIQSFSARSEDKIQSIREAKRKQRLIDNRKSAARWRQRNKQYMRNLEVYADAMGVIATQQQEQIQECRAQLKELLDNFSSCSAVPDRILERTRQLLMKAQLTVPTRPTLYERVPESTGPPKQAAGRESASAVTVSSNAQTSVTNESPSIEALTEVGEQEVCSPSMQLGKSSVDSSEEDGRTSDRASKRKRKDRDEGEVLQPVNVQASSSKQKRTCLCDRDPSSKRGDLKEGYL